MPFEGDRLLPRQVAKVAYAAGWTALDRLVLAVAVAQAESQFYDQAYYVNDDGSTDRGLWQINDRAHPEVTKECAYDAACCAVAAHRIYVAAGYSFQPWAAYTSGRHEQYLGVAVIGVANMWAERLGLAPVPYVTQA